MTVSSTSPYWSAPNGYIGQYYGPTLPPAPARQAGIPRPLRGSPWARPLWSGSGGGVSRRVVTEWDLAGNITQYTVSPY